MNRPAYRRVRSGEDAVREIVADIAPAELPSLELVLLAYRGSPWSASPGGAPAGLPEDLFTAWGAFTTGWLGEVLASTDAGLFARFRRSRPALSAPMPALGVTTRAALRASAYTAAIARGCPPEVALQFAGAVERAFQPRS